VYRLDNFHPAFNRLSYPFAIQEKPSKLGKKMGSLAKPTRGQTFRERRRDIVAISA